MATPEHPTREEVVAAVAAQLRQATQGYVDEAFTPERQEQVATLAAEVLQGAAAPGPGVINVRDVDRFAAADAIPLIPSVLEVDTLLALAMDAEVRFLRPALRSALAQLRLHAGLITPEEDRLLATRFFRALGFTESFIHDALNWEAP